MQTLQRKSCQTRTRPRKKGCAYGAGVSGATIYAYVGGDPVSYRDPMGLLPIVDDYFVGKEIACLEETKQMWAAMLRRVHATPIDKLSPGDWYILQNASRKIAETSVRQGGLIGKASAGDTVTPIGITGKPPSLQLGTIALGMGIGSGCR